MDLAPWQWIAWTNGSLGAFAGVQPAAARDDAIPTSGQGAGN